MDVLRDVLASDPRVAYALLFGSHARGRAHATSDVDVAIGFTARVPPTPLELGGIVSRLEHACTRPVDLLVLDEAPPALAYRVFRDGRIIVDKDHRAFVEGKAKAILEYLDFQPLESLAVSGVIAAAARGR